jgi:bifunctional DNase/RNase
MIEFDFSLFKNEKGESLTTHPLFKEMLKDFKWSVEKVIMYANSKGASKNVIRADEITQKYDLEKF